MSGCIIGIPLLDGTEDNATPIDYGFFTVTQNGIRAVDHEAGVIWFIDQKIVASTWGMRTQRKNRAKKKLAK